METVQANDNREYLSISAVSEATGVPAVTLRAWERRYGFLKPHRTPKGHRLYTMDHIALIRRVIALLDSGVQVGRVSDILRLEQVSTAVTQPGDHWYTMRQQMLEAVTGFDEMRLDTLYNQALANYPIALVTRELITPLLHDLGVNWQSGKSGIAEEHFFSLYIRNKLGSRWHHGAGTARGKRFVAACMPGECHEFGLLLFALVARGRGLDPVLLGGNMPLEEISRVVERTRAEGVVISCTIEPGWQLIERDLRNLVNNTACQVFVGGAGTPTCNEAIRAVGAETLGADIAEGVEALYRNLYGERSVRS